MLEMFKSTPRAKIKRKMAKGKMKWDLNKWNARRKWYQFRTERKMKHAPWKGIAGGVLGGAAGLAAFFAVKKMMSGEEAKSYPQSGQAPGRSHIQLSSHPAAQSRFQPGERQFGT